MTEELAPFLFTLYVQLINRDGMHLQDRSQQSSGFGHIGFWHRSAVTPMQPK